MSDVSLSLSFFSYKLGFIILTSQGFREMSLTHVHPASQWWDIPKLGPQLSESTDDEDSLTAPWSRDTVGGGGLHTPQPLLPDPQEFLCPSPLLLPQEGLCIPG